MKLSARPVVVVLTVLVTVAAGVSERIGQSVVAEPEAAPMAMIASMPTRNASGGLWFCPFIGDAKRQGTIRVSRSPAQATDSDSFDSGPELQMTVYNGSGEVARKTVALRRTSERITFKDLGVSVASPADAPSEEAQTAIDSATDNDLPTAQPVESQAGGYALTVESSDPTVLIEADLATASGNVRLPCSTMLAPQQWFPAGSAALGHDTQLALFNPFPEAAVIDLSFLSERGPATPTALQGLVVNGNSVRMINVGRLLRYREQISTHVTVRTGRAVSLERLISPAGPTFQLPAPEAASQWFFPASRVPEVGTERFVVANPSESEVTIEFRAAFSSAEAEPFELTLAPQSVASLDTGEDGRVRKNQPYAMSATVVTGPSVFIARVTDIRSGSRKGLNASIGSPSWSTRWAASTSEDVTVLTILNPFEVATTFVVMTVDADGKEVAQPKVTLNPDSWKQIVIPTFPDDGPLIARMVAEPVTAVLVDADPYAVVVSVEHVSQKVFSSSLAVPRL
jgi:Family of unknown function (DUF5719)